MSQNTSTKSNALSAEDKKRILAEETAILGFTEEVLRRMEEIGVTKSELASKMGIEPAAVSRLIGGSNNFTLKTMANIARALRARLGFSLIPTKPKSVWAVSCSPQFRVGPYRSAPSSFNRSDNVSHNYWSSHNTEMTVPGEVLNYR